jgi:hypothetical protein
MRGGAMVARLAPVAALMACCLRASAAPTPIHLGPGQPPAYAWQPNESWPGGSLADGRLGRPVRFWRAGLSLPEVFAGIEEQTGVAISVWPPTDPAARMRVTLYLNREQPPTLREVMAQLSWVTRYGFACSEGPARRYFLLGTGEVTDVEGQWAAAQHRREAAARQRLLLELERYRAALDLSRGEAIARYRGKDDLLLLTLLDPERHGELRVLCSLSPDQLATLVEQGELTLTLSDRALARRAGLPGGDDESEWLVSFHMYGGGSGRGMPGGTGDEAGIQANFALSRESPSSQRRRGWPPGAEPVDGEGPSPGLGGGGGMSGGGSPRLPPHFPIVGDAGGSPEVELEVRRILGEVLTEECEREFRSQAYDRWQEESRARRERELGEAMRAAPQLSAGARRRLEQITITWRVNTWMGPLWHLQGAVAGATGLSVISDCFEWGDRQFADPLVLTPQARERMQAWREETRRFAREHPEEWHEMLDAGEFLKRFPGPTLAVPVLDWLTALCYPGVQTEYVGRQLPQGAEGWEWGDAGPFLRFRSPFPEVWRGAMLPGPVERVIEESIQPYLKMAEEGTLPKEVPFPLDLRTQAWVVSQLDGVQLRVGLSLAHDDPATAAGQLHNSLVTQVILHLSAVHSVLRFLATLRDDQWEALGQGGLNAWEDLTPEQRAAPFIAAWVQNTGQPEAEAATLREVHLRLFARPGKSQPRLGVRGPEGVFAPAVGIIGVQGAEGSDAHRSEEAGETCFDFSAPLQTEVVVPPPLALSRRE